VVGVGGIGAGGDPPPGSGGHVHNRAEVPSAKQLRRRTMRRAAYKFAGAERQIIGEAVDITQAWSQLRRPLPNVWVFAVSIALVAGSQDCADDVFGKREAGEVGQPVPVVVPQRGPQTVIPPVADRLP